MNRLLAIAILILCLSTPIFATEPRFYQDSCEKKAIQNLNKFYEKFLETIQNPDILIDTADNISMLFVHIIQAAMELIKAGDLPACADEETIRHYLATLSPDIREELERTIIACAQQYRTEKEQKHI